MDVSCVLNRRSVREYTDQPISDEQLMIMLKAGMYAPSARNSQPWEFIVLRERDKLDTLSDGAVYWKMLKQAPLAIIVLANLHNYQATTQEFFKQDCAASTLNILNAAEGLGLGGVWLGVYGAQERMEYVRKVLGVPEDIHPFSILSIGHPKNHPAPHDFFHKEKVHYEKY